MTKFLWRSIKTIAVALGSSVLIVQNLLASSEPISNSMAQIPSVSELRDVSPTGWAYESLRNIVERYGCIVGYPDGTYRGNRVLTRWEFAAGLNACLSTIKRLMQENVAILKEDLDILKRLAQEFETELMVLEGRIDRLEGRTAFLEDHQFSTTTKLKGEVIFALADSFGERDESQTILSDRVRLSFNTSFTGKDLLRVRFQAGNVRNLNAVAGTDMARLGFDRDNGNDIAIDDLYYRFPIGDRVTAWIGTSALELDDVFSPINPVLESSGSGSLSRFGRRNPLVYRGPDGAGVGLKYEFSNRSSATVLYLVNGDLASTPQEGNGLFNGAFSMGAQLQYLPIDRLTLAFTYLHTYQPSGQINLSGSTGSAIASDPFDGAAATAERFGLQASWKITDSINFATWGGYATAEARGGARNGDNAELWTWNANVSFLDFGKEGAILSLAGGMPPKASRVDGGVEDRDSSYILEAQYQYPLADEILITPGLYVIFNPDSDSSNDPIWVGVVRTTFTF